MTPEHWTTIWSCPRCLRVWEAPKEPGRISERRPDCADCGSPALWRGEKVEK